MPDAAETVPHTRNGKIPRFSALAQSDAAGSVRVVPLLRVAGTTARHDGEILVASTSRRPSWRCHKGYSDDTVQVRAKKPTLVTGGERSDRERKYERRKRLPVVGGAEE